MHHRDRGHDHDVWSRGEQRDTSEARQHSGIEGRREVEGREIEHSVQAIW